MHGEIIPRKTGNDSWEDVYRIPRQIFTKSHGMKKRERVMEGSLIRARLCARASCIRGVFLRYVKREVSSLSTTSHSLPPSVRSAEGERAHTCACALSFFSFFFFSLSLSVSLCLSSPFSRDITLDLSQYKRLRFPLLYGDPAGKKR